LAFAGSCSLARVANFDLGKLGAGSVWHEATTSGAIYDSGLPTCADDWITGLSFVCRDGCVCGIQRGEHPLDGVREPSNGSGNRRITQVAPRNGKFNRVAEQARI
jgi:hypothetical protein